VTEDILTEHEKVTCHYLKLKNGDVTSQIRFCHLQKQSHDTLDLVLTLKKSH